MKLRCSYAISMMLLLPIAAACENEALNPSSVVDVPASKIVLTAADASAYSRVLSSFLDEQSFVNYQALKESRRDLDAYVVYLSRLDSNTLAAKTKEEQLALWINAYNALTIRVVIDNYPIQSSFAKSLLYPKNSIRQIPGAWKGKTFRVAGQKLTLDAIEHQIIRKQFNEPRIHMALVCAARSCPPLRNEPYNGSRLSEQLDDQTKQFLASKRNFRIDKAKNKVSLSSIFKWFEEDFEKVLEDRSEQAVLNFVTPDLDESERVFIETGNLDVDYIDYDWTLNSSKL